MPNCKNGGLAMKKILSVSGFVIVAFVLAVFCSQRNAYAAPVTIPGVNNDGTCEVKLTDWEINPIPDIGISLRTALWYANNYDKNVNQRCKKGIKLAVDVKITTPIVVNVADIPIDGNGHTIDASGATIDDKSTTDGLEGKNCAIRVMANDVKIKNIVLRSAPNATHDAICVDGVGAKLETVTVTDGVTGIKVGNDDPQSPRTLDGATLDGVHISATSGDGIVLVSNGASLKNSDISTAGDGVVFMGNTGSADPAQIRTAFENITINAGEKGMSVNGNNNLLKDVTINAGSGDALQLKGKKNTLNKVKAGSTGGHGIYIDAGSADNKILPNVEVGLAGPGKYAIADNTTGGQYNMILHTNKVGKVNAEGDDEVDDDGIIQWLKKGNDDLLLDITEMMGEISDPPQGLGTKEMNLVLSGSGGRAVWSSKFAIPVITRIEPLGGQRHYRVYATFLDIPDADFKEASQTLTDEDGNKIPMDYGYTQFQCKGKPVNKSVSRLAIYTYQSTPQGSHTTFAGYVGQSPGFGVDPRKRQFVFAVDGYNNPVFKNASSFVLIPTGSDNKIVGRASNYKTFAAGQNDCSDGFDPEDGGGGGGVSGGSTRLANAFSVPQCNADNNYKGGYKDALDSDQDGIPDYIERSIGMQQVTINGRNQWVWAFDPATATCDCGGSLENLSSNPRLTCWYKPDSDGDGLLDLNDGYLVENWHTLYDMKWREKKIEERVVHPINTDEKYQKGDNVPDVRDMDSDKDDLEDGIEDRNRGFAQTEDGFYRHTDNITVNFTKNGQLVSCKLEDKAYVGVKYKIYYVYNSPANGQDTGVPQELSPSTKVDDSRDPEFWTLGCVNPTIMGGDFDGSYDRTHGETNPRTPDTDGDCVCDYSGGGCDEIDTTLSAIGLSGKPKCWDLHQERVRENPDKYLNDRCPQTPDAENKCALPCLPGISENEILRPVQVRAAQYVTSTGGKLSLADSDGNGTLDLFDKKVADPVTGIERPDWEFIARKCNDLDRDGIPDCVERPEGGQCQDVQQLRSGFNPYTSDTDNDGLVDGMAKRGLEEDVCPLTPPELGHEGQDRFSPEKRPGDYTCDPTMLYTTGGVANVLSCFLDRDNDSLRDCEEDKNMNGRLDGSMGPTSSLELKDWESNPLSLDTDGDTLGDLMEMKGWPWPYVTNPSERDTDHDGLDDPREDRDGDGRISVSLLEGQGCDVSRGKDTDPRDEDTDDDTIRDGFEVAGQLMSQQAFYLLIEDPAVWTRGGIEHGSSPLAHDSDGDGLKDEEEYNGRVITFRDSNPCLIDSDRDGRNDKDEPRGCRLNGGGDRNVGCADDTGVGGIDSDHDGLPDDLELKMGTNPNNKDTDGDSIWDGVNPDTGVGEDLNLNGIYERIIGETDPKNPDTDGDGMNDGLEWQYGTDPTVSDTDGDCIPDGPMTIIRNGQEIHSAGEDANLDGQWNPSETKANEADTDGDGLADGFLRGAGEDLNCNGTRDVDANGRFIETDPTNPDSDFDGTNDREEMFYNGQFNVANIDRANSSQGGGCSIVASADASRSSAVAVVVMLLAMTVVVYRRTGILPCLGKKEG